MHGDLFGEERKDGEEEKETQPEDDPSNRLDRMLKRARKEEEHAEHVDMNLYKSILQSAVTSAVSSACDLRLPWETDLMRNVFGVSSIPKLEVPTSSIPDLFMKAPPNRPEPTKRSEVGRQDADGLFQYAVGNFKSENFEEESARTMEKALEKWLVIVGHNYEGFTIGDEILSEYKRTKRAESSRRMLAAAFGVKAPGTIDKRAGVLGRFLSQKA